jgi:hypothetical protein
MQKIGNHKLGKVMRGDDKMPREHAKRNQDLACESQKDEKAIFQLRSEG